MGRVRLTIAALEKEKKYMLYILSVCVCVCVCVALACKVHAPYSIVICGLSGSTKYFHIIPYMTRFREAVTEYKLLF